jgi:glycerophosphoryl diester phosphodiesterase
MLSRRRFIQSVFAASAGLAAIKTPLFAASDSGHDALSSKLVIAHRGASGYLPEHSLEAKTMAYTMGAHFLEQDVVLSRDQKAVVLHDLTLDAVTDVADRFPGRQRQDGKFYVIDFDLSELQTLSMHERVDPRTGKTRFPDRFPGEFKPFSIHTLEQEIILVQGLNHSTGRTVGIYPELKDPEFHRVNGMQITEVVIDVLHRYGYRTENDPAYLQCFDAMTLQKIRETQLTDLRLVQLIGENRWWPGSRTDYEFLKTAEGLKEIAQYAMGIGPWYRQIYLGLGSDNEFEFSTLVRDAHQAGLEVHPYTLRADQFPPEFEAFDDLLAALLIDQNVDGVFTDHTDLVRRFIDSSVDYNKDGNKQTGAS